MDLLINKKNYSNVKVIFSFKGKFDGRMQLAVTFPVCLQPLMLFQPWHGLLRRTTTVLTKREEFNVLDYVTTLVADPIKLLFFDNEEFFCIFFADNIGHFTINYFFLHITNTQAKQQKLENEEKKFYRIGHSFCHLFCFAETLNVSFLCSSALLHKN